MFNFKELFGGLQSRVKILENKLLLCEEFAKSQDRSFPSNAGYWFDANMNTLYDGWIKVGAINKKVPRAIWNWNIVTASHWNFFHPQFPGIHYSFGVFDDKEDLGSWQIGDMKLVDIKRDRLEEMIIAKYKSNATLISQYQSQIKH